MRWTRVLAAIALAGSVAACQPVVGSRTPPAPPTRAPVHVVPRPALPTGDPWGLPAAMPVGDFWGSGPKVVVIGDSLATSAAGETRPKIWNDHGLSWNTVGGTAWTDWTGQARSVVAAQPAIVVVELGTNSIWDGYDAADQHDLDRFLRALGAPACTVLVGYASGGAVKDLYGRPNLLYPAGETAGNEALRAAASARTADGAATIWADWSSQTTDHAVFASDDVHLSPAGREAWAGWVNAIVRHVTSTGACEIAPAG